MEQIIARTYAVAPNNVIGKAMVDGMMSNILFSGFIEPDMFYTIIAYESNGTHIIAKEWKPAEMEEVEAHKLSITTFSALLDGGWEDHIKQCALFGPCCGLNMFIQAPMMAMYYSVLNDDVLEGHLGVFRAKLMQGDDIAKALCFLLEEGDKIYRQGGGHLEVVNSMAFGSLHHQFGKMISPVNPCCGTC